MRTIGTLLVVLGLFLLAMAGFAVFMAVIRAPGADAAAFTGLVIWFPGAVLLVLGCLLRLAFKADPEDREPMPPPRTEPFQP